MGEDKVAYVFALGTNKELGAIDDIGRALARKWINENGRDTKELKIRKRNIQKTIVDKEKRKKLVDDINNQIKEIDKYNETLNNPYSLKRVAQIKSLWQQNKEECKAKFPEICYYMDGIVHVKISASRHPAGVYVMNTNAASSYGILHSDGKIVLQLDMDAGHEINLVKYDLLKLKSVKVLKNVCDYLNIKYPRSYEIDWDDEKVWDDLSKDTIAIPQFEDGIGSHLVKTMKPKNIQELTMINAALRPSGASYRNDLAQRKQHHSTNPEVDNFLKQTYSFLIFQENIMEFLQEFCGFTGSESDDVRRNISSKDPVKINAVIPKIIDGYCNNRNLPREDAQIEAQEYVQVIKDASSYAFNKSHAAAYSQLGYVFAYYRYYYPAEFICAFLNHADNDDDIINGTKLAILRGYTITEPKFRYGRATYSFNNEQKIIYKGMGSIKYLNNTVSEQLYSLRNNQYNNFFDVIYDIKSKTKLTSKQLNILIRLDFFNEFGNARELLRYVDIYNIFITSNNKFVKTLSISKVEFSPLLQQIVENNSTKTESKYKIIDIQNILHELSLLIQSQNIKDFTLREKIAVQQEFLGYIGICTHKQEDRPKLVITSIKSLVAKKGKQAGTIWARVITTHSIGSGINGEFMILEKDYQSQYHFSTNDIIYAHINSLKKEIYNNKTQWWIKRYILYVE